MTLIERLENAEQGSRELDWAIWEHLGYDKIKHPWGTETTFGPNLTTSISAAVALAERVLPDHGWNMQASFGPDKAYRVVIQSEHAGAISGLSEDAPTAALALCIALLKALEAKEPSA